LLAAALALIRERHAAGEYIVGVVSKETKAAITKAAINQARAERTGFYVSPVAAMKRDKGTSHQSL